MKLQQINYNLSTPTEIEIKDPVTNKSFENPAFLSVYSIESKQGKTVQLNIYRDIMAWKEANKDIKPTEELMKEITTKHLSTLIVGWKGIEDDEGNEVEYSPEKALELITEFELIFNAVNLGTAMMGNFLKK